MDTTQKDPGSHLSEPVRTPENPLEYEWLNGDVDDDLTDASSEMSGDEPSQRNEPGNGPPEVEIL